MVCMYGPGSANDVLIISSARFAAALIVLNAYVKDDPSLPAGTPAILSSPLVLTNKTSGELYAVLST